jgi:alpha-beta hydrolase superfamily lysophospholipase
MKLPTIVLVHGAWHQPANYQTFIDALSSAGFSVYAPRLPSCSNTYTTPPTISTAEDVAAVNTVVKERVNAGEHVLLFMHSYGGLVGTDALTDDLLRTTRAAAGRKGGVIHLLYLCAYLLEPGTSIIDIIKASGLFPMWSQFITNYDDSSTFPVDPALSFFSREAEADVLETSLPMLVRSPLSAFDTPAKGDLWKKLPITYVHTLKDYAVAPAYQTIMVERAQKAGVDMLEETYNTSHSIFITEQEEMVRLTLKAAKDKRNPE